MIFNNILTIWKYKTFRDLFLSGFLSSVARWLELLVFSLIIWDIFKDTSLIGFLVTLRLLSMMIVGFYFIGKGSFFSGRKVMLTFTLLCSVSCLIVFGLISLNLKVELLGISIISILSGCLWSVDFSFRRRMLADSLPKKLLSSGISIDVLSTHATRILGPLLGGVLLTYFFQEFIILFLGNLYLLSFLFLYRHQDNTQTLNYIRFSKMVNIVFNEAIKKDSIFLVLILTPIFNIFALPFLALISILIIEKFNKNALDIGFVTSLEGLGALLGGIIIALITPQKKTKFFSLMLLTLLITMTLCSMTSNYFAFIIFLIVFGSSTACYSALQSTIIYTFCSPELRSSVFSLITIAIGAGFIGSINIMFLSTFLNPSKIVLIMGLEGIILTIIFLILMKVKRKKTQNLS